MTVTTNYLVTGNGITGSTANAVQALVSGAGRPDSQPMPIPAGKAFTLFQALCRKKHK
jgi:hypothetical protein